MSSLVGRIRGAPRWQLGFYPITLVLLALVVAPPGPAMEVIPFLATGWGSSFHHAVHFMVAGVFHVVFVGALLSLLVRPERRRGAVQTVVLLALTAPIAFAVIGEFVPPAVLLPALAATLVALHPNTWSIVVPSVDEVDVRLFGFAVVAAVPLFAVGVDQVLLQRAIADPHAALGHYAHVGAVLMGAGVLAVLASLRPESWRVPAYAAAGIVGVTGAASIGWADVAVQGTGFGLVGGLLAIGWSVAFVGFAEATPTIADDGAEQSVVPE